MKPSELHPTCNDPDVIRRHIRSHPGFMTCHERQVLRDALLEQEFGYKIERLKFVRWLYETGRISS